MNNSWRNFSISYLLMLCTGLSLSCNSVYKVMLGAKDSKIETPNSTLEWLQKNISDTINADAVMTLSPKSFPTFFDESPMVFDNQGKLMVYEGCTSDACLKDVQQFLSDYNPLQTFPSMITNQGFVARNLNKLDSSFFNSVRALDGKSIATNDSRWRNSLILPFAKFLGNKKQVADLKRFAAAAGNNRSTKWNIIWLNFDKQEWWGQEWNQKISMGFN